MMEKDAETGALQDLNDDTLLYFPKHALFKKTLFTRLLQVENSHLVLHTHDLCSLLTFPTKQFEEIQRELVLDNKK